MYICTCVCMCVCGEIGLWCAYTSENACVYIYEICMCVCMYVCVYVCVQGYRLVMCAFIWICMCVCIYIYIYIYIHLCINLYLSTHIYIYIHIHIRIPGALHESRHSISECGQVRGSSCGGLGFFFFGAWHCSRRRVAVFLLSWVLESEGDCTCLKHACLRWFIYVCVCVCTYVCICIHICNVSLEGEGDKVCLRWYIYVC